MPCQRNKTEFVVDTNVPVVANGKSEQATPELVTKATLAILDLMDRSVVVIDEGDRILGEYRKNLNAHRGEPGVGTIFMRWIHDNCANPDCCIRHKLHCTDETIQAFDEYPVALNHVEIDISDRKFIAVANASIPPSTILQAVDFKWWGWRDELAAAGICVQFIDEEYAGARYKQKHNRQ